MKLKYLNNDYLVDVETTKCYHKDNIEILDFIGSAEPEFTDEELAQQELNKQIAVAKEYLSKTDHKFYNGYKPKDGEDLAAIELQRDEAREFIRANEVTE